MKNYLLINVVVFLVSINFVTCAKYNFFPNLPAGEYRLYFKAILQCDPPVKNYTQINLYISKKSANTTEIKGNMTSTIAVDDSYDQCGYKTIETNWAVKDSIGGWKDNAILYRSPKACSTMKNLLGRSWILIWNRLGVNLVDCPIPPGFFKVTGMDTSVYTENTNIPKVLFYGSYKAKFVITKNKKIFACIIVVLDVKRPWELE